MIATAIVIGCFVGLEQLGLRRYTFYGQFFTTVHRAWPLCFAHFEGLLEVDWAMVEFVSVVLIEDVELFIIDFFLGCHFLKGMIGAFILRLDVKTSEVIL